MWMLSFALIARLKDTHDQSKVGQSADLKQMDSHVCGELKTLHEGHAAIHIRLGEHSDEHVAALKGFAGCECGASRRDRTVEGHPR